uniref:Uncharacterized protein n=1 Tax=viral metagenome TaxID=1070528 RepID=A0A6C0CN92_9ZZZZ
MSENIKIIKKDNINVIQELFSKFKKAVVFGKGPTFKVIEKDEDTLFCCVNETINYIDDCDILVINDIEKFSNIIPSKFTNLKCILTPYHIHKNAKFDKNLTYNDVIMKLKDYFNGYLIVHNLAIHIPKANYDDFITLPSKVVRSTCHTSCDFIFGFLTNIVCIDTYGFGISNSDNEFYNESFKNNKAGCNAKRLRILITCMNSIKQYYNKPITYK